MIQQSRVLIIGGGVSGLSTAWWLAQHGIAFSLSGGMKTMTDILAKNPLAEIQTGQRLRYLMLAQCG